MHVEASSDVLCYSHVKSVAKRAEDIHEMHCNRIASFDFARERLARSPSTHRVRSGPFDSTGHVVQACLQLAARSVVMSEALAKAESNGDPNGIRTHFEQFASLRNSAVNPR
jgi:hypothetical protein